MEAIITENKKNNLKYTFWLTEETSKMIDERLDKSRFRYRSEFVAEAIRRYCCDLDAQTHRNVLTEETERIMDAKIQNLGNRMARINFKLAVELAVMAQLFADYHTSFDKDQISVIRSAAMNNVRKSSGFFTIEDAFEDTEKQLLKAEKK